MQKVIIIGAAGRDFHNFNTLYRDNPAYEVACFTATQIPQIAGRRYPPELAGSLYPHGIPIYEMAELEELIRRQHADACVFSYTDISYVDMLQIANRCLASGAGFIVPAPKSTYLHSSKPVVAVLAVRTGAGKSQTSRRMVEVLHELNAGRVVSLRHPMPYGDLAKQAVQRFASLDDLASSGCTIEELEEFEPHIAAGNVVYAGVDYARVLAQAEAEADVILWDGGNNDTSFIAPDLSIVVADPLRPGHELTYYAGETNITLADLVIVNKCDSAREADIATVEANVRSRNPRCTILRADSPVAVDQPELIAGKRVLVVEDGPTLTHGNMATGAGWVAAKQYGAAEIIAPAQYAVGSLAEAYAHYPQISEVLPALGYFPQQLADLAETIRRAEPECVVIGTPVDLRRVVQIDAPAVRVRYELREHDPEVLRDALAGALERKRSAGAVTPPPVAPKRPAARPAPPG